MSKDSLAAFASRGGDQASNSKLKESYMTERALLEKSLPACKDKLADKEYRTQKFKPNDDTLDEMATKVDEAAAKMRLSKESVHFLEDKLLEQSRQWLEKNASLCEYREHDVEQRPDLASVSADVRRLFAKQTASRICLTGSIRFFRSKLQLHSSVFRHIRWSMNGHWLVRRLSKPSFASFRKIWKPKLIQIRRPRTTQ